MRITRDDPTYPKRLLVTADQPAITLSGPLSFGRGPVVAIAGSRRATEDERGFAQLLARELAKQGATIVSGGAVGIDRAAHEGALAGGGATWVVMPCGRGHATPRANIDLFDRVARGEGGSAMIWPFPDGAAFHRRVTPRARNAVLVALADAVVVIRAHVKSGSRNTCTWAKSFGRPLWVVPGAPWDLGYAASSLTIAAGARPLTVVAPLFLSLGFIEPNPFPIGLGPSVGRPTREADREREAEDDADDDDDRDGGADRAPDQAQLSFLRARPEESSTFNKGPEAATEPLPAMPLSGDETVVFSALSVKPSHRELITRKSGLSAGATITALLTLSLKNVVVEGPDGFFRRHSGG